MIRSRLPNKRELEQLEHRQGCPARPEAVETFTATAPVRQRPKRIDEEALDTRSSDDSDRTTKVLHRTVWVSRCTACGRQIVTDTAGELINRD